MNWLSKRCVLPAVLALTACGSSSAGIPSASTPSSMASGGASAALASKLGLSPDLVEKALSAAKSALGGSQQSAAEKTAAAQLGVNTAANEAEASGQPLAAAQKSGLLEGLKNML